MSLWSNKTSKSVTFSQEVADQTLLAAVETELAKQPHKTFSDLCKEALWQFLYIPDSTPSPGMFPDSQSQIAELQRQLAMMQQRLVAQESAPLNAPPSVTAAEPAIANSADQQLTQLRHQIAAFEERLARESGRFDVLENQLYQLIQQLATSQPRVTQHPGSGSEPVSHSPAPSPPVNDEPPTIDDPLLSSLSSLLPDDF